MKKQVWELVKELVDVRTRNVRYDDWHPWLDDIVEKIESLAIMIEERGSR